MTYLAKCSFRYIPSSPRHNSFCCMYHPFATTSCHCCVWSLFVSSLFRSLILRSLRMYCFHVCTAPEVPSFHDVYPNHSPSNHPLCVFSLLFNANLAFRTQSEGRSRVLSEDSEDSEECAAAVAGDLWASADVPLCFRAERSRALSSHSIITLTLLLSWQPPPSPFSRGCQSIHSKALSVEI